MRVLICTQHFWPESFRINVLAQALERHGAQVTVLTGQPNYPEGKIFPGYSAARTRRELFGTIDVVRMPLVVRGPGGALRLVANYLSYVLSASVLGPWQLRDSRFDIVFVYATSPILQAIPAIAIARARGVPLVTWVQDLWPDSLASTGYVTNPAALRLVEQVVRWIYRASDLLLGQSRAFVHAMQPLAESTPIEYFPNPGEEFGDPKGEPALRLPPGFNVVFTGNLGTVQALETVLDAADLLRDDPEIRFVLVGSGSRASWLAAEVARRDLANVSLPGRFDVSAMPGILAQASALLVTLSRSRIMSLTIPSKVQGYLAAGRPIIASLDGEGAEVVREADAGLASAAEDARGLAENVRALKAAGAAEQARMGASGRRFYEGHFQPDVLAKTLMRRFQDLVATPS